MPAALWLLLSFVTLCSTLDMSTKEAYVISKRTLASSNGADDASFWVTYFGQTGQPLTLCMPHTNDCHGRPFLHTLQLPGPLVAARGT